jgi:pimeloyl-ACP methyl ester carboxylesterase
MSLQNSSIILPSPVVHDGYTTIAAPSEASFISEFGSLLPVAQFLTSAWGNTAYYNFPPKSNTVSGPIKRVLFIHGIGTPALGMLPLASKLHAENPSAHFVLYDLWGHGLSSTPLVPHVPALFHSQILQLLERLQWPTAHFVGYSFGCPTSVTFFVSHPERVESVAFVAPAGLIRSAEFSPEQQAFVRGGENEDGAREFILKFLGAAPLVVPEDWRESFKHGTVVGAALWAWEMKSHQGHITSVISMFTYGGVLDHHEAFKKASEMGLKPLAVLGGDDDVCTIQDLKDVGFDNVIVVPAVGHELVRQSVPEVAASIDTFWKGLN